jgi:hypothetical protein
MVAGQTSSDDFFNAPDADVLLRSSTSDTTFAVHRCILAVASPMFRDMFALPQVPGSGRWPDLPVIDVTEDASTLDALLRLIYPVEQKPAFTSIEEIVSVLAAAAKYETPVVTAHLRARLVSAEILSPETALRIYAIADRFDLEDVRKEASRQTLGTDLLDSPLSDDLKGVSAWAYHRLLAFHKTRRRGLIEALDRVKVDFCQVCHDSGGRESTMRSRPFVHFCAEVAVALDNTPSTDAVLSLPLLLECTQKCNKCGDKVAVWIERVKKAWKAVPDTI